MAVIDSEPKRIAGKKWQDMNTAPKREGTYKHKKAWAVMCPGLNDL
jgi:hypothetical protein